MTNIRRYYVPDAPVFITAVCYQRKPFLKGDTTKELLLSVMREVKLTKPFGMLGYVILDDHFHWIIKPQVNPRRSDQEMSGNSLRSQPDLHSSILVGQVAPWGYLTAQTNPCRSGCDQGAT